jgi:hypothetical protein
MQFAEACEKNQGEKLTTLTLHSNPFAFSFYFMEYENTKLAA